MFVAALVRVQAASTTLAEFPFQAREGLLWVEVAVPQSGTPLNFLLDTGASASVVNLSTAKRLGLRLGRPVSVSGVQTTMIGYWPQRLVAKASGLELPRNYLAVDLGKLSHSCERPVDGLIGADFFRDRVVQIDYETGRVRLLKPKTFSGSDQSVPLQLRACGMRVPISVNGQKHEWVRLDTGCTTALQWVTSAPPLEDCSRKIAIGFTELCIPQTETQVALGEHTFANVPTGLHRTAIFPGESGLLGNGLLTRFSAVTIDTKTRQVHLTSRRN